jgi:16S rRNA (adenine1518-N6/adenine1519-N6)-dimethyltransferase
VESAVARLAPLGDAKPAIADSALFARIVAAAFGQRRKTLRNALSSVVDIAVLQGAGIDPGARGETLSVGDFVRLANYAALA